MKDIFATGLWIWFSAAERRKSLATAVRGCCPNGGVASFPLLCEEGWTRPQQNIAKPPLWSGRGGDQIPQNFVEVEHHLLLAARYRACIRSAHPRLRELRMLRDLFLIAQRPLLGEEGTVPLLRCVTVLSARACS